MLEVWIGFVGGILIGATGVGSGSLITPILILAGHRPAIAVGTGLGTLAVSKTVGAAAHHQLGHWPNRSSAWVLVAGGVVGVGIVWFAVDWWLKLGTLNMDPWIKLLLGPSLLLGSAGLLWPQEKKKLGLLWNCERCPAALFVLGAVVAAAVALTSAGSGTLLVTLLLLTTAWEIPQLAATSNAYGMVVAVLSFLLHLRLRSFDLRLFELLLLGLIPGVIAGTLLSRLIARRWFVRCTSVVSFCLGVGLLLQRI